MGTEINDTQKKPAIPKLSELMYEAYMEDGDSLASFCYDYIDKNLLSYLKNHTPKENKVYVPTSYTKAQEMESVVGNRRGQIRHATSEFVAELQEAMADYIITKGVQNTEIRWPADRIRIDTIKTTSPDKEYEAAVNNFLQNQHYVDLLDTHCSIPNRPTPLERKISVKESEIESLKPAKKHPVRRFLGWVLTFLFFLNTAAALLMQFLEFDLQAWLQDFCYKGLVSINMRAPADIVDSLLENLMISGNLMRNFGKNTQGSFITLGVTVLLFILGLYCMIHSKRKHIADEAARVKRIETLNEDIQSIRSSVEFYDEVLHRQAVANYHPEMMKAFRKACGRLYERV